MQQNQSIMTMMKLIIETEKTQPVLVYGANPNPDSHPNPNPNPNSHPNPNPNPNKYKLNMMVRVI